MQSQPYAADPIPDETIANLVHQHLVTDSPSPPSEDNNSKSSDHTPRAIASPASPESSARPTEEIPIPYHLPGASITHDIYTHANSLRSSGSLNRSRSTSDIRREQYKDKADEAELYENLSKPGGFRRFFVHQQQQHEHDEGSPADVGNAVRIQTPTPPPNLPIHNLFRPMSTASGDSNAFTDYSALHLSESVGRTTTLGSLRGVHTRHFLEYLAITSVLDHFAGENLSDTSDDEVEEENTAEPDEEAEPLLRPAQRRRPTTMSRRDSERRRGAKASVTKTAFLLFKAFISSGILFLPRAFSNGGLGFSIITLYSMGAISLYCFLLLLDCKKTLSGSYGDIGGALYGEWMRQLVLFSIAISQLGFTCGGTIFIVENVIQAVRSLSHNVVVLPAGRLLCVVALLLMPLVLIRNIAKLSSTALFADALIVMGLLLLLGYDIFHIFFQTPASFDTPVVGPGIQWWLNPVSYPVFMGTAVYAFEGIGLIIPIRDAMEQPAKFPMVLTMVMILIATSLAAVGALGYIAFGQDVQTVALLNLPEGVFGGTVQLGYALAVHLTNPLALFPTIRIVEHGLFGERTGKHSPSIKWQKNALRCSIVIVCVVIAWIGANDLDKFISLIGSICCCPLSLIFPPLFHLHLETTKGIQRRIDQVLVIFGMGVMVFTLWNTSMQWGSTT